MNKDKELIHELGPSDLVEGGHSCSTKGAALLAMGIKGALPLLHAGPGCSYTAFQGHILHTGESYPMANTALGPENIVFGGEDALRDGIKAAWEIHKPEMIVVIPGCQAATIGDDVDSVIDETDYGIPIISSNTSGYDGNLIDGFNKAAVCLLRKLCEKRPVKSGTVNIIGFPANFSVYWEGDIVELKSLLSALGLTVNCIFPGECTIQQLRDIPSAALNIVADAQLGMPTAQFLNKEFGMKYIVPDFDSIIGFKNTRELLIGVAEAAGLDMEKSAKIIKRMEHEGKSMAAKGSAVWNQLIQDTFNTFAITASASQCLGLVRTLMSEIGMRPTLINLNPSYPGAVEKLNALLEADGRGFGPIIMENGDSHQVADVLDNDYPYIVLGRGASHVKCDALLSGALVYLTVAYPAFDRFIIYNRPLMGYSGVSVLIDDIMTRASYFF